jgi:thymidylate kinase
MSEPASSVPNLAGSLVSEVQLPQAPGYPARRQRVLILVGLVGSGKTTFSQALASGSSQWVRASQDDAPSRRRQECEELARRALRDGKDVIVDRVDFDPSSVVLSLLVRNGMLIMHLSFVMSQSASSFRPDS